MEGIIGIWGIGFLLGIKHALEPDHVIAVSTMTRKHQSLLRSGYLGFFWGLGHTLTLLVVFLILFLTKGIIPVKWELTFELAVGIMLIYLGFAAYRKREDEKSSINKALDKQFFLKSMIIGQIHGLAGSAAMTLLTLSLTSSLKEALFYILIFGAGTSLGMLLFTFFLSIPFIFAGKTEKVSTLLNAGTSAISICYGTYYIYRILFQEGLFT